jgi:dolichol kinase
LIGIAGIVDVNVALHASIGGLRVAFILQRHTRLSFSLSLVLLTFLLSRAKRDLWNYCCCETFAAGFLFDDYIHVYVSERDARRIRARMAWIERAAHIFNVYMVV